MYRNLGKHNLEKSFFSEELARIIDNNAKKKKALTNFLRLDQNLNEITV